MQVLYIYADGASRGNPGEAGAGMVIMDSNHHVLLEKGTYLGKTTNNVAEYRALILALGEARRLGAQVVKIFLDSELLVRQLKGVYRVKSPNLRVLFEETQRLLQNFNTYDIMHIRRNENSAADRLANQAINLKML
jgi:ribonuclease HI